MKKRRTHIIIGRTLLTLLVSGAIVLLFGAMRNKEEKMCSSVNIMIGQEGQKGFVNKKDITALIKNAVHATSESTPLKQFDLRKIERMMEQNDWIKDAQLYFDNNEVLHVQIEQRFPIARMMDISGASYYIDSVGYKLPLSLNEVANVPVFTNVPLKNTGSVKIRDIMAAIICMSKCIMADSFWLAQAAQIDVLPTGKFQLYPAFGKHVVELGDGIGPADKLNRLKLFYKNVSVKKGFDAYPVLSVAFDRQVVALRSDSVASDMDAKKTTQAFEEMVKINRATANKDADELEGETKTLKQQEKVISAKPGVKAKPPDIIKRTEERNKGNPIAVQEKKNTSVIKNPKALMPKGKY